MYKLHCTVNIIDISEELYLITFLTSYKLGDVYSMATSFHIYMYLIVMKNLLTYKTVVSG